MCPAPPVKVMAGLDWSAAMRTLAPLFDQLDRQIATWFDERPGRWNVKTRQHDLLVLVEHFDKLRADMDWLVRPSGPAPWSCLPPVLFPAVVALAATAVAARRAAPKAGADWTVPDDVRLHFLKLWIEVGHCRAAIAPQVVAAHLGGGWAPRGVPLPPKPWEPAVLLLQAIVHQLVQHGVYKMEQTRLPQWVGISCDERSRRTAAGTHVILLWLRGSPTPSDQPFSTCAMWDWDVRNLWEFLGTAILGPGRAGSTAAGRPHAGAFKGTLFGLWASTMEATIAGTIEVFVCVDCRSLNDYPECPAHTWAVTIATARKKCFAAPKDRLDADLAAGGHVMVERNVCKNPPCVAALQRLVKWGKAQPLYPRELQACTYCGAPPTGQRPATVWTKAADWDGSAAPGTGSP